MAGLELDSARVIESTTFESESEAESRVPESESEAEAGNAGLESGLETKTGLESYNTVYRDCL